jgi:glycine oxidase
MKQTTDVAIVGGGIIGCAIAYNLRKAGAEVTLLERGEIGAQASSAAAGLLAPLGPLPGPGPLADLLLASFAMFPTLVPELEEASGLDLDYERSGALRTVRNPKRVPNLQKRMDAWKPLGLQMHWLSGDEARKLEPLLSPDISAAIYVPEESQIQASTLVNAFARAANNAGATLLNHTEVIDLQRDCDRITGVWTGQDEIINCKHLILATGAWAGCYDEWLDLVLPVFPLRGQILAYQQPTTSIGHIIFGEAAYLAPRGNSVIVGATKEDVGFDTSITDQGQSWLVETATRLVPSLNQSSIQRAWAGLRPKTPDAWPILGPAPQWENVTLATGHNSVGIILSAITGQMIAECVARSYVPDIIHPFSITRFEKE